MFIKINSQDYVLDTNTKTVYPLVLTTGENNVFWFDENCGVHLNNVSKEWVSSLSDEDIILINEEISSTLETVK